MAPVRDVDHRFKRSWPPLKMCGRGQYVLPPAVNVTFFHSKLLLDNSASFTSWRLKDACQKWKVKLIFRGAWSSLMAWPDWPWPSLFYDIIYTTGAWVSALYDIQPANGSGLFNSWFRGMHGEQLLKNLVSMHIFRINRHETWLCCDSWEMWRRKVRSW